jgi:ABC-2 type transport system permease protein
LSLRGLGTVLHLTWRDMRRRRIVAVSLFCVLLFLCVFAVAIYFIGAEATDPVFFARVRTVALTIAGLYVAHFLAAVMAIIFPLDTLSGEIDSGVMQTLVSKPVSRVAVLSGKWLAHWLLATAFAVISLGGVTLISRIATGLSPQNVLLALPLMALEMGILVTIVIAGGTRFNTVTNAIVAFGLFAFAFIGGWIEQIGALAGSATATRIGIGLSLLSPNDAISRLVAFHLQPPFARDLPANPFSVVSAASPAMIAWAAGYVAVLLGVAARVFARRPL